MAANPPELADPVLRVRMTAADLERLDQFRAAAALPRAAAIRLLVREAFAAREAA